MTNRLVAGGTLGAVVVVAALWLALGGRGASQAEAAEPPGQNAAAGVSVVGEGVVVAQPDQGRAIFGVEIVDPSLASAQREAAARMQAVLAKLQEMGVDQADVKTVRFTVRPEYKHESGQATLVGYRVSNAVSVKVRDLASLGAVIDGVVSAGAVQVEGIGFEVADPSGLKDQARERAMAQARAKAEQLAQHAGLTLGQPKLIEESDTGGVPPVMAAPSARMAADVETPIVPGELEIRAQVRVVYAVQ